MTDEHNADPALELIDDQFGPGGEVVADLEQAHREAYPTRERWLRDAIELLRQVIEDGETKDGMLTLVDASQIRVSCAWPSKKALTSRIGECWDPSASEDDTWEIMISYMLGDPVRVLDILLHELLHVACPRAGHKTPFKRACDAVGLLPTLTPRGGKTYTATVAGPALTAQLEEFAAALGAYPHAPLKPSAVKAKKQKTRLIKVGCDCGIIARMTQKYLDSDSLPTCICGERWKEID
jgi:hypothetical protein